MQLTALRMRLVNVVFSVYLSVLCAGTGVLVCWCAVALLRGLVWGLVCWCAGVLLRGLVLCTWLMGCVVGLQYEQIWKKASGALLGDPAELLEGNLSWIPRQVTIAY